MQTNRSLEPLKILQPLGRGLSEGHRVLRLLHHTDLLDCLGNRLTSPHLDFDLSQLRDDLLGQFFSFFPRGMECPLLVLTLTESLSGSGAV